MQERGAIVVPETAELLLEVKTLPPYLGRTKGHREQVGLQDCLEPSLPPYGSAKLPHT